MNFQARILYNEFRNCTFKIKMTSPRGPMAWKTAIQAIQNPGFRMHSVYVNGSPNTMGDQANIISHDAVWFFIALQPQKQPPFNDI